MKGLDAFIDARRGTAFAWGSHDCATLAADWALQRTGVDPLADLRGTGTQPLARMRLLRSAGGYMQAAIDRLGPARPGAFAQRGDVVLLRTGHRGQRMAHRAFGVCVGIHAVTTGAHGLVFMPVTDVEAAWCV